MSTSIRGKPTSVVDPSDKKLSGGSSLIKLGVQATKKVVDKNMPSIIRVITITGVKSSILALVSTKENPSVNISLPLVHGNFNC
jgi:hypothetical protein